MNRFLSDAMMLAIAAENNLSETAFLAPEGGEYRLRWFTPQIEVPLCATQPWPVRRWSWSAWTWDATESSSTRQADR
jgi:hypothetical protein